MDTAVDLARIPEQIRGYGHVRDASAKNAEGKRADLRNRILEQDAAQRAA
ncbi:DUF6537 domain-containing protein [Paraburkholderia terrae]